MLILRDVLGWPAAEVAELLGTTTTAVNSGLRRARAQLARVLPAEDDTAEPNDPARRAVLDRFAAALENGDTDALAELLRKDVMLEMPPLPGLFAGRDMVRDFFAAQVLTGPALFRLVPTAANGQPAFAAYQRGPGGVWRAHAVIVLATFSWKPIPRPERRPAASRGRLPCPGPRPGAHGSLVVTLAS